MWIDLSFDCGVFPTERLTHLIEIFESQPSYERTGSTIVTNGATNVLTKPLQLR